MSIQYPTMDSHGVYLGMVDGIPAMPPDVGWYAPEGVIVAASNPPTDAPGRWLLANGTWKEYTPEEKASVIRQQRDAMLSATDYRIMPDYPISDTDRDALRAYRQALRDIPEQPGFPNSVVWPIKGE
jgi:hypothetical protein